MSKKNTKKYLSPKVIKSFKKQKNEAFKSNIANLYTEDDPTLNSDIRVLTEQGYWGDVIKAQVIYDSDPLTAGIMDRLRYTANQRYNFNIDDKYNKEQKFWEEWGNNINETAKGIPMGLSSLFRQMFDSMIKTGMTVPDTQWEKVRVGRKTYNIPTKITTYPSTGTKLNPGKLFGEEDVWVLISEEMERERLKSSDIDEGYDVRYMGDSSAPEFKDRQPAIFRRNAEAIKFNWTPNNMTLYPTPILKRAFKSISLRHKYIEADMSLLNGIIERIIQVKVGNKDIELFTDDEDGEGDISLAASMFEDNSVTQMVVTPWYYDIKIIQPDTDLLTTPDKYIQTTMDIMSTFGILTNPDASNGQMEKDDFNIVMMKEYVKEIQQHVSSWMNKLCREIVRRNPSLKGKPNFTFDTPDFEDSGFKENLIKLYNIGMLDAITVLEKYDICPETTFERLKKQKRIEEKEGILQVRESFSQTATKTNGSTITNSTSKEGSRPSNGEENVTKGGK